MRRGRGLWVLAAVAVLLGALLAVRAGCDTTGVECVVDDNLTVVDRARAPAKTPTKAKTTEKSNTLDIDCEQIDETTP